MAAINQGVGLCGDALSVGGVGTGAAVDALRGSIRAAPSPIDCITGIGGTLLGHYRATVATTAILPSASVVLTNFRFVATASLAQFAVILRVRVGVQVTTAVTAATESNIQMAIVRAYTASETTNISGTNPTLTGNNMKMRTSMVSSSVAQIAGASAAAGMTGGTGTQDTTSVVGNVQLNSSIGLVGIATGTGPEMCTLFESKPGEYPLVLATNEGFRVNWGLVALATGTLIVTAEYTWAEVNSF